MTLYELNQAGYSALPRMSKSSIEKAMESVALFMCNSIKSENPYANEYFMLLNNESHYYTIFVWKEQSSINDVTSELLSIVKSLGTIKAIEKSSNGEAYEFWITGQDGVTRMYAFFNYNKGVIEV